MALIRFDHVPQSVGVNLPLYIILPDPGRMQDQPVRSRKVLYLLHGLSDDGSAWQRFTTIESLATAYGLVVVMPSAGRSFYSDQPNGQRYYSYLAEELPLYLRQVFGLAPQRADTLIAGNSMGGYGAFKLAFDQPERFLAAASFSGVLSFEFLRLFPDDPRRPEFTHIFGDLDQLRGSAYDPAVWFEQAARQGTDLPRLYLSCGRQEDLYPINQMVAHSLQELGIPVEYHEDDARHDWFNWDTQIRRFLASSLGPVPTL